MTAVVPTFGLPLLASFDSALLLGTRFCSHRGVPLRRVRRMLANSSCICYFSTVTCWGGWTWPLETLLVNMLQLGRDGCGVRMDVVLHCSMASTTNGRVALNPDRWAQSSSVVRLKLSQYLSFWYFSFLFAMEGIIYI